MTRRIDAIFEREEDILEAARRLSDLKIHIVDLRAPYPLPQADPFLHLRRSRLPWICFLLGLVGALAKIWFEFWASAVNWPLNVGGKPWNSLPAFVPVTFEIMVLVAGVSTILAFFARRRLFPGKRAPLDHVSGDFALRLELPEESDRESSVQQLLRKWGASQVFEEREDDLR